MTNGLEMESLRQITVVGGETENPARFLTTIEPIKLNYDAEIAITSLYHGEVYNIHSGNNKVFFYVVSNRLPLEMIQLNRKTPPLGKTRTPLMITVPEGYYKSSFMLIRTIAELIKDRLGIARMRDAMQVTLDRNFQQIAVSLNNIYLVVEDVKDTPWGLLRVYEDKFTGTFMVDDETFDSADNPAFIYASIIENSYINGKLSRNLGIVPIRYTSNWSLYEPTDPNYVPINVKEFSKILIEIRDMNGEYIKFNPKFKTVLNLKIKAIKRA